MNTILIAQLRATDNQLEAWATEAKTYGWSTQHVQPMLDEAKKIRKLIGY